MNNSQDITIKQNEMYRAALSEFILHSRKIIQEQRDLHRDYVLRNFARIQSDNNGGYNINQYGQTTLRIRQPSTLTQRSIQLR